MKRFWISWHSTEPDYRPVNYPPRPEILGWWVSGSTDEGVNIVALVQAKEPENASAAIIAEWPELKKLLRKKGFTWRFFQTKEADFLPGDRFQLNDWMKKRLEPS